MPERFPQYDLSFAHIHAIQLSTCDTVRASSELQPDMQLCVATITGIPRLPDMAMKVAPLAVAAALTRVVLLQPGGP